MNKSILFLLLFIISAGLLTGCGTHTSLVRTRYAKIASLSTESNNDKFMQSSFNNFFTYKTSLHSDFGISYFYSYRRYVRSEYASTSIYIYSSMLYAGENFLTLGNLYNNSIIKRNNETTIVSYLILQEFVITKSITLELKLKTDTLTPGRFRGTISDPVVTLVLKDETGKLLFDISDENSYVALEIVSVDNNIAYGTFTAQLVGHKEEIYLSIKEGEFWIKL